MTGMNETAIPVPAVPPLGAELDWLWPDDRRPMPLAALVLAAVAGAVAAVVLPAAPAGLGVLLLGASAAATTAPALRGRLGVHEIVYAALAGLLLLVVVVRDADWFVTLALLGFVGTASFALTRGRSILAVLLGGVSLPLAVLRSLPWVARGLRRQAPAGRAPLTLWLRPTLLTIGLLAMFGTLFASADAVFAALLPDLELDVGRLALRAFLFAVFTAVSLAAAFLAAAPPRWDVLAPKAARPVRLVEWVVPIGALVALFCLFVGVQLTALFGGNEHILRTAGLTHADYARSGFGQLVAVTLLTLTVVGAAARWAPRGTARERLMLRVILGSLCLLTLVVVASALYRLHLYEEAFGFTRLRLFMNAFESWLGLLVLLVMAAGVRLDGRWLGRALVATAAATLLALAAVNPDGFVAHRNVDRWKATGKIDVGYLGSLSADAVPAVDRLPEPLRSCVLNDISVADGGIAGLNAGRSRARALLDDRPPSAAACLP